MNTRSLAFLLVLGWFAYGCSKPMQHGEERTLPSAHVTHARKLSDIKFTADMTKDQVAAVWGEPDGKRGFGIAYVEYTLEDGQEVWIQFMLEAPYRLLAAIIVSPQTGQHKILFEKKHDNDT
jgi:hypothetical protein